MTDELSSKKKRRYRPRRTQRPDAPPAASKIHEYSYAQPVRSRAPAQAQGLVPLKDIDVGEPDANAEYFISQRSSTLPMYLRAYYDAGSGIGDELSRGSKFVLHGQKGTGKTAILRHLESISRNEYETEFVVFRKEIVEEAQLASLASTFSASVIVDEEKIKETRFYYHAMKRLLLTLLLAKSNDIIDEIPEDSSWFRKVYSDIKGSSVGQIASLVTDSVVGSIEAVNVDVAKLSKGAVKVNPALAVKRSNDAFQKFAFSQFEKKNLKARVFLDEMHFAYRDKQTLGADASLVRDTVLAVREINEKLIERGIDSMIYMSIRSEFLEHQEIAVSDIAHTIESYGTEISWENSPYDRSHPMFLLALARIQLISGPTLTNQAMQDRFFPVRSIEDFLQYTWGKPRDVIRYLKAAKQSYPNNASIRASEYGSVIRRYSQAAWQDVKAALTAFVPKNSLPVLEEALQVIANANFDSSRKFSKAGIEQELQSAYRHMQNAGVTYEISELVKLLYIVGVLFVQYRDAQGQTIVHQFHRGNRHPAKDGNYYIHRAVARAFS